MRDRISFSDFFFNMPINSRDFPLKLGNVKALHSTGDWKSSDFAGDKTVIMETMVLLRVAI